VRRRRSYATTTCRPSTAAMEDDDPAFGGAAPDGDAQAAIENSSDTAGDAVHVSIDRCLRLW
jgi:hypothetical protein